jgi:D-xylulose 5-phosphate/D-fructose 6-phosphate phosphoketolase
MTTVTVRVFYRQAAYGGWEPGSLHPSPGRLCALTTGVTALTGRHGLINCYDAFIHLIDSMVNQRSLPRPEAAA